MDRRGISSSFHHTAAQRIASLVQGLSFRMLTSSA